jgi:hypothetical protein
MFIHKTGEKICKKAHAIYSFNVQIDLYFAAFFEDIWNRFSAEKNPPHTKLIYNLS